MRICMQQPAKKIKFEELDPRRRELLIDALFTYHSLRGNDNPEKRVRQTLEGKLRTRTKWRNYICWKVERANKIREKFGLEVAKTKSPSSKDERP